MWAGAGLTGGLVEGPVERNKKHMQSEDSEPTEKNQGI